MIMINTEVIEFQHKRPIMRSELTLKEKSSSMSKYAVHCSEMQRNGCILWLLRFQQMMTGMADVQIKDSV